MRSLMIFGVLALGLTACVDVHNPPPETRQQQPNTVVVPATPPATTTVICPAGTVC